jgi:GT2 family glycosyltransferase
MRIKFVFPYSFEKNLGEAYNREFEELQDNDWLCITDADVMLLGNYGKKIKNHILSNKNIGILTCYTNRVKKAKQLYGGKISENDSIRHHANISMKLELENYGKSQKITAPISGFLMVVQKKVWKEVGGFNTNGILNVDNDFSNKVYEKGYDILLMQDMYAIHYYRMTFGIKNKEHLK